MTSSHRPSIGQQIAADLRAAIQSGKLPPGQTIESERKLVERYGTTKVTVRKVIETLKAEGLLVSEPGSGIRVREIKRLDRLGSRRHLRSQRPAGTSPLEAEAAAQGVHRELILREVISFLPPPGIADLLQITPETPLVVRRHLVTLDGHPAATADSYIPAHLVEGSRIARHEPIPGGVHAELADLLGTPLTGAVEMLVARMPNPDETETLRLPPGTPVVELTRTIHAGDRPVEVTVWLFDASRHRFVYEVPVD
ncbi:GntR family transcriptional regulator [Streptosporangium sp. NPDC051022]|uniref:GntR family transcriptional regulator n=1 Tax=Streptosporangium sp. NPDC051022 TaxID=3155752 RepID=UPI003444FE20